MGAWAQPQTVEVSARQWPANKVILQLSEKYRFQVSFNDAELSKFNLSLKGTYPSVTQALEAVVKDLPFTVEKAGDVFMIYPDETKGSLSVMRTFVLSGTVKDAVSGEVLPYSSVEINGELRITDISGRFSFESFVDEHIQIKVQHLGFEPFDTLMVACKHVECHMQPAQNVLGETVVLGIQVNYGAQIGNSVGESRLNPRMGSFLPGSPNNAIGQLLGLLPGIQSATTPANSLSMWGSAPGQSLILFDGIPVYPTRSGLFFPINTYVVKDVMVNKGALGAQYGNQVGGIVELTGIDGNRHKTEGNLTADASAVNGMLSVPVGKIGTLVAAARHSWFPHYFNQLTEHSKAKWEEEMDVWLPDRCNYRDANLKFSGFRSNGDHYRVSWYGNNTARIDSFTYLSEGTLYFRSEQEQRQQGISLQYGKQWANGMNTNLQFVSNKAQVKTSKESSFIFSNFPTHLPQVETWEQMITQNRVVLENRFSLTPRQFVEAGVTWQQTQTQYELPANFYYLTGNSLMNQITAFMRNHIAVNRTLMMDIGVRLDYLHETSRLFVQPRLKSSIQLNDIWKMNLSLGIFNQYLSQLPVVDNLGNYEYVWQGYSGQNEFLQSDVAALGVNFTKQGWTLNTELYTKGIEGIARYLTTPEGVTFVRGRTRTTGVDILIKKEFGKHALWQSYSYGDNAERFVNETSYRPLAFQRQHESKTTALFHFKPIKLSLVYIYCSPTSANAYSPGIVSDYQRLDAMASGTFNLKSARLETGVSVLNALNQVNSSSVSVHKIILPDKNEIIAGYGGVPFYFSLFFNVRF